MIDIVFIIAAYLLGSISSAIIVCRLMRLPDPRSQGSNNPGATNVLRIGGKKPAAITLFGDMLKGFIPVLLANLMGVGETTLAAVAMAVFLGHLYPLFFHFQGGKGVATALGVQFGLSWMIGGSVAAIWLFMGYVIKISSLSALVSMALAPIIVWLVTGSIVLTGMSVVMTLLLFWRHRSNIQKLLAGKESKIAD